MNTLVIIPARGGSKGIIGKNIKKIGGKPLIEYTLDIARNVFSDEDICVSTDDENIVSTVEGLGLRVPFMRPPALATDTATTNDVILHALDHYEQLGRSYDTVVLLQPTSPFRKPEHIYEAIKLYNDSVDMIVSVSRARSNPYYDCYEENMTGYLEVSKGAGRFTRRQDVPEVWMLNGSIYVINVESLRSKSMAGFKSIVKYPMEEIYSVDIDTPFDWKLAEFILQEKIIQEK